MWTDQQKRLAKKMRMAGKSETTIAEAVGRTRSQVAGFFRRENILSNKHFFTIVRAIETPPDVWADRDRRANEYRDTTALICGDPPFSQSALARR